jgi:carbon storage regulator
MLVLKRKQGQAIDVGDDVKIILKEIRGGQVKVLISAPKEIRIKRSEIAQEICNENIRAVQSRPPPDKNLDSITDIDRSAGG